MRGFSCFIAKHGVDFTADGLNNADMNQKEIQQDSPREAEAQPLESTPTEEMKLRPIGLCAGEFVVPDDFDDPLPDWLLDAFEGKDSDY